MLFPVNFNAEKPVSVNSSVNLTVQITTNSSLTSSPTWSRPEANLPDDSHTMSYSKDGNDYTTLIIDRASYSDDGGMYIASATNQCGTSNLSVVLNIYKKGNKKGDS